ncbi:SGNH hydrolase-type esterase domain-containing protein [Phascolomyces articulosus]|uniref:SGNH hydrolase-type esterase domain-containing protein n=1 Tax=Phascolomyces articulosus TaxID=60185 RepID=A0AAD5PCV3_9FUNG|nr:SGNH hydrolase-type esterase domain-containing protein [Phascolomyces articulosus]
MGGQYIYTQVNSYQVLQRDFSTNSAAVKYANGSIHTFAVGGPYQIDDASHVLVGDIWLLAGQSNMRGNAFYIDPWTDPPSKTYPDYVDDMIHLFQSNETWAKGQEPTHRLDQSVRQVDYDLSDPSRAKGYYTYRGVSPGMAFAKTYKDLNKDVPVGLLATSHGGTTMEQWSPDLLETTQDPYNNTLYGAMLGRIEKATGGSNQVAGILWYQGESDAGDATLASEYENNLASWIKTTRSILKNDLLPFLYVQVSRVLRIQNDQDKGWNQVREAQRLLNDNSNFDKKRIGGVASIDLEMDDYIHLSGKGQTIVGQRLAIAATNALRNKASTTSPTFASVKFEQKNTDTITNTTNVAAIQSTLLVKFKNVKAWKTHGEDDDGVYGFSLHNSNGDMLPVVFKSKIQQDKKSVRLFLTYDAPKLDTNDVFLYYGYGMNPICNMETVDGMGLLAFGPVPVQLEYP